MKRLSTAIVIGAFLAIAVFGAFAMKYSDHAHGHCIATIAQRLSGCPNETDSLAFLSFHLNAFKSFSTATINPSLASIFLVTLLLTLLFKFKSFFGRFVPKLSNTQFYQRKQKKFLKLPFYERLTRWLALHENSPSVI